MKIIINDLYCQIERWDDPGDYPNGLAAGPLPSYNYCDYGGILEFEAETPEELGDLEIVEDWIHDYVNEVADISSYCRPSYDCKVEGNKCIVKIKDAEAEEPEPDYPDRYEDY